MTRGNPNLKKNAAERREHTEYLIREAAKKLEESFEIKSHEAMSQKTKEIDPKEKGVSVSSFRNKELTHIQDLMIELGIGKYEALRVSSSESENELADQLLEAKKEIKKKDTENNKLKQQKKRLVKKVEVQLVELEELRAVIYEMDLRKNMRKELSPINNNL